LSKKIEKALEYLGKIHKFEKIRNWNWITWENVDGRNTRLRREPTDEKIPKEWRGRTREEIKTMIEEETGISSKNEAYQILRRSPMRYLRTIDGWAEETFEEIRKSS